MPLTIGRLRKRSEYLRVASAGRKSATKGLVLQALDRGEDHPHADTDATAQIWLGITASRRVGGAVQRNRVKRRLRAAAAQILPTQATANFDYVLIGRHATLTRAFPALLSDLETALRHVGQKVDNGRSGAENKKTSNQETP
jgi:ribonuclease P protein component